MGKALPQEICVGAESLAGLREFGLESGDGGAVGTSCEELDDGPGPCGRDGRPEWILRVLLSSNAGYPKLWDFK